MNTIMKKYIRPTAEMIEAQTFNLLHGDSLPMHDTTTGAGQLSKKNFVLWEDDFDDDESSY
ncbi:MAG: hypothetical protein LUE27_10315 [Clostridia bacterium]|nr:hypothetical protein [Clostridia bacterium]